MDNIHLKGGEELPLDPVSYSLAKKAKKIAENHALDSHTDVEITSPTDGEVLTYDAANAVWKNAAPAGGEAAWLQLLNFRGIFWFNNNWLPEGMIYNGTGGSGSIVWGTDGVFLTTGNTANSYAYVYKHVGSRPTPTWDKKRHFICNARFLYLDSDSYAWVVMGRADHNSSSSTNAHVGFKAINGSLYGTVGNGSSESTLLLATLGSDEWYELKVVFTPGVEARFYLDGVDKGSITTNLPSGTGYAERIFYASVYNTTANYKYLFIPQVKFVQEE